MLADFLRRWIGGVRFFLTLVLLSFSAIIIVSDIRGASVAGEVYLFLGGVFAQVCVFIFSETVRKT